MCPGTPDFSLLFLSFGFSVSCVLGRSQKVLVCLSSWHWPEVHERMQDGEKKRKKKTKDIASSTCPFLPFSFYFFLGHVFLQGSTLYRRGSF